MNIFSFFWLQFSAQKIYGAAIARKILLCPTQGAAAPQPPARMPMISHTLSDINLVYSHLGNKPAFLVGGGGG